MVLFLDRVYGIENQDFLLHVLDVGFLPDMRAAASLDTVSNEPAMALQLGRGEEVGGGTPSCPEVASAHTIPTQPHTWWLGWKTEQGLRPCMLLIRNGTM